MIINVTIEDIYTILQPVGSLDAYSSIEMDECMERIVKEQNPPLIIIDGSLLAYISSAGIGVFIKFLDLIHKKGGGFVFAHLQKEVHHILTVLGLDRLVAMLGTLEEAKEKLNHAKKTNI